MTVWPEVDLLKRARPAPSLQNAGGGEAGCLRLHRNILQSSAQARQERDAATRRVWAAADFENRSRLEK